MREEELILLFETIEAIIDDKAPGSDICERVRVNELKQACINVIAFGESLEDNELRSDS